MRVEDLYNLFVLSNAMTPSSHLSNHFTFPLFRTPADYAQKNTHSSLTCITTHPRSVSHTMHYKQKGISGLSWKELPPGQTTLYVFDDPLKPRKLLLHCGHSILNPKRSEICDALHFICPFLSSPLKSMFITSQIIIFIHQIDFYLSPVSYPSLYPCLFSYTSY